MFTVLRGAPGYVKSGDRFVYKDSYCFSKLIGEGYKRVADYCVRYSLVDEVVETSLEGLLPYVWDWCNDQSLVCIRQQYTNNVKVAEHSVVAESGEQASYYRRKSEIELVNSNILVVDVDSVPRPDHIEYWDLQAQGRYVISILSEVSPMFTPETAFIAKTSGSAGFSDMIKLHMFFEQDKPLDTLQQKTLIVEINNAYKRKFNTPDDLLDPALYSLTQPHFFARPKFVGVSDPFANYDRVSFSAGAAIACPDNVRRFARLVNVSVEDSLLDNLVGGTVPSLELERMLSTIENWEGDHRGLRVKVVAAYHKAVQCSFELKLLDRIILPLIEKNRSGMGAAYIKQARKAALQKFVERSARELPKELKGIPVKDITPKSTEFYLDLENPPPANSLTFMKASLGTGKTYSIEKWIKENKIKGNFLTITNNVSLVEANAKRFGSLDFRDARNRLQYVSGTCTSLSGTIHSLQKLENMAGSFDFVFIDEADSVLSDLLFASIISEDKKHLILNTLCKLLRYTSRVVISDGDLSEESANLYSSLVHHSRPLYSINHRRKTLENVPSFKHYNEDSLWGCLDEYIKQGNKCLVVSDCSPDALNEKKMILKHLNKRKNIFTIHSNSKKDPVVVDIINDTNDALRKHKVDCLLCSPSITAGVDFRYFDAVFVLTVSDVHPPNLRLQALRRERKCEEIHYMFKDIKRYKTGFSADIEFPEGWKDQARQDIAIRRERESEYYVNTFQYYLLSEGATIELIDPYDALPCMEDEYMNSRVATILGASVNRTDKEHNDSYEIQQFCYSIYDVKELMPMHVVAFLEDRPDKCAEFLHSIYSICWSHITRCSPNNYEPMIEWMKAEGHNFYLATGMQPRAGKSAIKSIVKKCGVKILEDKLDFDASREVYRKWLFIKGEQVPQEFLMDEPQDDDLLLGEDYE